VPVESVKDTLPVLSAMLCGFATMSPYSQSLTAHIKQTRFS